jgi:hypothetical protein
LIQITSNKKSFKRFKNTPKGIDILKMRKFYSVMVKNPIKIKTSGSDITIKDNDTITHIPISDVSNFKRFELPNNKIIYFINCGNYSVTLKNPSKQVENWMEMCMKCYADRLPTFRNGSRRTKRGLRG